MATVRQNEKRVVDFGADNVNTTSPILPLVELDDGWWIDASELTPDVPQWGPYDTKSEANEDRRSFVEGVREERRQRQKKRKG